MNQPQNPETNGSSGMTEATTARALGKGIYMETELVEPGYLGTEFIAACDAFFVPRQGRIFGGCGDDRPLTAESAQALTREYQDLTVLDPAEGFASIYGGLAGISKNIAIVGTIQDPNFLDKTGGLDGITQALLETMQTDMSEDAVYFGLHSAEADETAASGHEDRVSFCSHGNSATGCAYCGGVGATSAIIAGDPHAQKTARENQIAIFGNDDDFERFIAAHQQFVDHEGATRAVDRSAYTALLQQPVAGTHRLPFMMLEGAHVSARNSGVIINFDPKSVGSARKAHDAQHDIYREDVAIAAEVARKTFPHLDAELLLRAFVIDSTAVRAVLASVDADPQLNGILDPTPLAIGVRGDVRQAIKNLENL